MGKVYDFFGGRKFFFALVLLALAVTMVVIGKADFSDLSEFVMWVFGIYAVGNIGSKAFEGKANKTS